MWIDSNQSVDSQQTLTEALKKSLWQAVSIVFRGTITFVEQQPNRSNLGRAAILTPAMLHLDGIHTVVCGRSPESHFPLKSLE